MSPKQQFQKNRKAEGAAKMRATHEKRIREEAWKEMANYIEQNCMTSTRERMDGSTVWPDLAISRFMADRGIYPKSES